MKIEDCDKVVQLEAKAYYLLDYLMSNIIELVT
jgi:hypothetical protein